MKKLTTLCLAACLAAALATPAGALDYAIDAPGRAGLRQAHLGGGGTHGRRRGLKNEDISKNAALIPPGFGSASAEIDIRITWLTPNLAPEGMAVGTISGSGMPIVFRPLWILPLPSPRNPNRETESTTLGYTP